jgi:hypothetical protein
MHATLTAIRAKLTEVIANLRTALPSDEPLGNVHNNWSFPGLTRSELIEEAQSIITLIDDRGTDDVGKSDARLNDYIRRLEHLRTQTIANMWGNAGLGVPAYMLTLDGLRNALEPALKQDEHAESVTTLRRLANRLRGMEAKLRGLEPRTSSVDAMVERIEKASSAADQLPTDLESLAEARQKMGELVRDAVKDQSHVATIQGHAEQQDKQLESISKEAAAVLERCESAYSAATSVGLAAAFSEKSATLSRSIWGWVLGLIGALAAGSYFGYDRLHALSVLFTYPNVTTSVIVLNLLLSLLSVAAPVWFAWLATKQIGQRFRLAEDYAYKAAVSRAYEGFRREASRFDKDMESRLLVSALNRLDELPLRLVEPESHGSPWHELASSSAVKAAMRSVPGFAEEVKGLAGKALSAFTFAKGNAAAGTDQGIPK